MWRGARGRGKMKRLTTAQASACENAKHPGCRCRCGGAFHGASHALLLRQEAVHEAELLEVSRENVVHLYEVWGMPNMLPVSQRLPDLQGLEGRRLRDSGDEAQIRLFSKEWWDTH